MVLLEGMIQHLKIDGFKSIKGLDMEMLRLNLLIGANGSGKSNFISFFRLITSIFNSQLQNFVSVEKTDNILYYGRKVTDKMTARLIFSTNDGENNNSYNFSLAQDKSSGLFIEWEGSGFNVSKDNDSHNYFYESSLEESKFAISSYRRHRFLQKYMSSLRVFHFHDTSSTSVLRSECDIDDNEYLKPDGRNLPAFLYLLQSNHPKVFNRIVNTVQTIAPYIEKFILEPNRLKSRQDEIRLRWVDKGDPESSFSAYQLSDGTLRFIALATLLMQPSPPATIIIDEPELGLHPFALGKLAGMLKIASKQTQIIAATQSPGLISHFSPEDIIVADRNDEEARSVFKRLDSKSLSQWLGDYTLGDLWERNIINSAQPFMK